MPTVKMILLVDDSELILDLLQEQLANLLGQAEFVRAAHGEAALKRCREQAFDLIITDIVMPKVDGLELIAEIRHASPSETKTKADCPILIVSSYIDRTVYDFAKQHAPCMIMRKPFSMQHLQDQIDELLGQAG